MWNKWNIKSELLCVLTTIHWKYIKVSQSEFIFCTIDSQPLQLPEQTPMSLHFIKFLCKNDDTQNHKTTTQQTQEVQNMKRVSTNLTLQMPTALQRKKTVSKQRQSCDRRFTIVHCLVFSCNVILKIYYPNI